MTPATAPTPTRYAIDVRSIGQAGPDVHRALQHVMKLPHQAIVARLYQAPNELLTGLEHDTAVEIAEVLSSTGLDVAIRDAEEVVTPGKAEFDVSIHLNDPGKLPAVAQIIAEFLGCDLPKAAQLLWASPAMLVGSVSQATVDALRDRLAGNDVSLDVSRSAEADYDLYISECAPAIRRRAEDLLLREQVIAKSEGPLLALGLRLDQTQRLWRVFQSTNMPVTVLNRDFQRFDLRLDAATDSPELRALIVEVTGMPKTLVTKVLAHLPMTLVQGEHSRNTGDVMARFSELGADISAHLIAFRSFNLEITRLTDVNATAALLATLTDVDAGEWSRELVHPPSTIAGPFSQTRARWMRHELIRTGAKVRLNER